MPVADALSCLSFSRVADSNDTAPLLDVFRVIISGMYCMLGVTSGREPTKLDNCNDINPINQSTWIACVFYNLSDLCNKLCAGVKDLLNRNQSNTIYFRSLTYSPQRYLQFVLKRISHFYLISICSLPQLLNALCVKRFNVFNIFSLPV